MILDIKEIKEFIMSGKMQNMTGRVYGQLLKRRRKDRGITICELSERAGIEQRHLAGVELGTFELSVAEKKRIAKFLRDQRII